MLFWICLSKTCSQFLHQCWYKHDVWNPSYFNSTNPYEIQIFSSITGKIPFLEMMIQFFWRFPNHREITSLLETDLYHPMILISPMLTPSSPPSTKLRMESPELLLISLRTSTLLIKKEGQIKELSLLDTLQLFLELIKSTLTTVTSTSLTTTLTLSTSTENIITS